jgi:hypothetical protein
MVTTRHLVLSPAVFVQRCPPAASSPPPPPLPLHSALPRPIQLCSSKQQPDPRRRNEGATRKENRAAAATARAHLHPAGRPSDGRHEAPGAVLPHLPAHPVLQRQVMNRPPRWKSLPARMVRFQDFSVSGFHFMFRVVRVCLNLQVAMFSGAGGARWDLATRA